MVHKEPGLSSPRPGHERTLVARVPITDGCFHGEQGRGAEPKDLTKKEEPEGKSKKPQACADLNPRSTGSSQPGQRTCAGPCGQQGVLLMKITAQGVRTLNCGNLVRDL